MVFEYIIRYRPRRRPSHPLAEGFSPTASPAERINFSKTICMTAAGGGKGHCSCIVPLNRGNAGARPRLAMHMKVLLERAAPSHTLPRAGVWGNRVSPHPSPKDQV